MLGMPPQETEGYRSIFLEELDQLTLTSVTGLDLVMCALRAMSLINVHITIRLGRPTRPLHAFYVHALGLDEPASAVASC